jgi:GMP synthase-like glutamine amidotransferase
MKKNKPLVYLDAIIGPHSSRCLFEETLEGIQLASKDLDLIRISIHPKYGDSPSHVFKNLLSLDIQGLILSGSEKSVTHFKSDAWVKDYLAGLKTFINDWTKAQAPFPILGICFAHQAIAHILGAQVKYSGKLRVGPVQTKLVLEKSKFFNAQDSKNWNEFIVYHGDHVLGDPKGMQLFLSSDYCRNQAFVHSKWPLITTQFHPEMNEAMLKQNDERKIWEKFKKKNFAQQKGDSLLKYFGKLCLKVTR